VCHRRRSGCSSKCPQAIVRVPLKCCSGRIERGGLLIALRLTLGWSAVYCELRRPFTLLMRLTLGWSSAYSELRLCTPAFFTCLLSLTYNCNISSRTYAVFKHRDFPCHIERISELNRIIYFSERLSSLINVEVSPAWINLQTRDSMGSDNSG